MSVYNNKEYHWVCDTCGVEFNSRKELRQHYKEHPEHRIKKSCANSVDFHTCQYCGKYWKTTLPGLHIHEKSCYENPDRINRKNFGVKMSDDFRKRCSEIMLERHRNGTASTLSQLRRREKPSYPEQWLMKVIENENMDSNYIREFPFHTFSLDFYWPEKKKVIEIDGRFHKISDYQKDCDKRKDKLLLDEGYSELRIDWEYCFKHTKDTINRIKDFLS